MLKISHERYQAKVSLLKGNFAGWDFIITLLNFQLTLKHFKNVLFIHGSC